MRIKKIPVFFLVYSLPYLGEKYVSELSKKLPLKCLKTHIFSGAFAPLNPLPGRCPGPNGGLRRPPYPRPMFFGLDGPMAHQVHFPDISLGCGTQGTLDLERDSILHKFMYMVQINENQIHVDTHMYICCTLHK